MVLLGHWESGQTNVPWRQDTANPRGPSWLFSSLSLFYFVLSKQKLQKEQNISFRRENIQLWARGAGTALRTWRRGQQPDPDFRIPHQCNSAASNKNRAQNSHIVDKNSVVQRLVGTVSFGIGAYPLNILLAHLHQLGHVRMDCVSGLWRWNAKVSDTFPKYVWVTSTQ